MTTAVKHLYRTLLTLDGNHPTVRTAVLDVHYLHDLVMSPYRHRFPNGWNGARQAMEILYATQPQRDSTLKVMIQSGQAPNWAPPDPTILAAEIQQWAFTPDFRPGQIVPFRLRCNPTRTPPHPKPHRTAEKPAIHQRPRRQTHLAPPPTQPNRRRTPRRHRNPRQSRPALGTQIVAAQPTPNSHSHVQHQHRRIHRPTHHHRPRQRRRRHPHRHRPRKSLRRRAPAHPTHLTQTPATTASHIAPSPPHLDNFDTSPAAGAPHHTNTQTAEPPPNTHVNKGAPHVPADRPEWTIPA